MDWKENELSECAAPSQQLASETKLVIDEANESQESQLVIDEKSDSTAENENMDVDDDVVNSNGESKNKLSQTTNAELPKPNEEPSHDNETSKLVTASDCDCTELNAKGEEVCPQKENITSTMTGDIQVIEIDDDEDNDVPMENPANDIGTNTSKVESHITEGNSATSCDSVEEVKEELADAKNADTASHNDKPIVKEADKEQTATELLTELPPRERTPEPEVKKDELDDTMITVFINKECINHYCLRTHKQYFFAPQFALVHYKVQKKIYKRQYICSACYDDAVSIYEKYCNLLDSKQPLLLNDIVNGQQEFIEIIDSSDDDDKSTSTLIKDNNFLKQSEIALLEEELQTSIKKVLTDVDIQKQLTWCKTILFTRLQRISHETEIMEQEVRALNRKADNMHIKLYQCPKIKMRHLPPLDLNTGRNYSALDSTMTAVPPIGELQRPPIQLNETYYAVKNKAIASWVPCKVVEYVDNGSPNTQKHLQHYKVKFLNCSYSILKTVWIKHMAYFDPPIVQLPIGSRVIAYFDASSLSRGKEKMGVQSAFYPGIIAEPLKYSNRYRYLIFYDDGYTQYVSHDDVRLVCHASENVWEDVHISSRDFIEKYLNQYAVNRPMVQTQKGQSMATESNGKWNYARVVDIDCSLIQMQFEGFKSTEWIYRGSLRLGPVYKEQQKSMQKKKFPPSRLPRRTEPFIRYTEDEESSTNQQQQRQQQRQQSERNVETRAVARKSTTRQDSSVGTPSSSANVHHATTPTVRHLNNSTIYLEDESRPKGKVVFYTAKRHLPPRSYKPHKCSPSCLFKISHNLNSYSPLSKPLLSGWERTIIRQKIKKVISYRAPCGLSLRNMRELRDYLRATENTLNVDNFDFSPDVQCLAEYVVENSYVSNRDISEGQENMAIPLVNYYDNTMPQECKYSAKVIPTEGVNINLDENFLVGCDCVDDCLDKEKCSCWQLTYAGAKYGNPNTPKEEIGYQYKRLHEHILTGVYECNSRCKCKSNCLNRVVQQQLQMKLQVFKTSNRGWGLRCLNDIPKGSFICIYAGHLLTEAKANEGGVDAGDEYFAELDYIEVAEQIKEGYESDVDVDPEEEDETYTPDHDDDDDDFTPSKSYVARLKRARRASTTRNNQDTDSQERRVINFNPNTDMSENSLRESSIRQLYGQDETCYIMDAKITGNLGRYFNHSCSPNLFVQNVFVDTHDLRFPWVAFFALSNIRAGTELTWNYNYEVGVVPGKVLYCQCGAPNCRLRLL